MALVPVLLHHFAMWFNLSVALGIHPLLSRRKNIRMGNGSVRQEDLPGSTFSHLPKIHISSFTAER